MPYFSNQSPAARIFPTQFCCIHSFSSWVPCAACWQTISDYSGLQSPHPHPLSSALPFSPSHYKSWSLASSRLQPAASHADLFFTFSSGGILVWNAFSNFVTWALCSSPTQSCLAVTFRHNCKHLVSPIPETWQTTRDRLWPQRSQHWQMRQTPMNR